jgi:hypothetical protein
MASRKTAFELRLLQEFEISMHVQNSTFMGLADTYNAAASLNFPEAQQGDTLNRKRLTEAYFRWVREHARPHMHTQHSYHLVCRLLRPWALHMPAFEAACAHAALQP